MSSAIELRPLPNQGVGVEPALNSSVPSKNESQDPQTSTQNTAPRLRKHVVQERVQLFALYWCLFLTGWNDGTAGPLLPRIQKVYHVGFTTVSLIFVFSSAGFITGALINVPLTDRLGFGKMITLGALFPIVGYTLQATAPLLPVFILSFLINGVGMAILHAQANGYTASLKRNATTKMGLLHGAYGAGAFAAPLLATQFSQMQRWSFYYLISLGIAISNLVLLTFVFRLKSQDECLETVGEAAGEVGSSEHSTFRQILTTKTVHLIAVFILMYVGIEVTIGGWIVTYLIEVRGGGPSSGYVSAGFFGGIMTGRIALLWLNKKIGERRVLYLYSVLAIGLELIVWLVPSLIGDAVAVSFIGLLLGPIYPVTMNQTRRILPRWLLTGSIGWIAGFGQAGSALIPFATGAIATKAGIKTLQPLLVGMMSFLVVLWAVVPVPPPRME